MGLFYTIFVKKKISVTELKEAEACNNKGNRLFDQNRFDDAIEAYDQAIKYILILLMHWLAKWQR